MSVNETIAKAAGIVGSATLLSRILGLIRDQVTAYYFGAGMAADAFFVAFRIPNLLRRLLAEGALTVSFIPVFTEYLTTRSRAEAFRLVHAALAVFSIILVIVTVLGILFSPWIIWAFAPGFTDQPDKYALTVLLTRIMFPYIFLVALVALAMGILNSLGKFAAPALSPVFLNIGMIGAIFFLSPYFDPPIIGLAIGVIIGGILQVLLQIPFMAKEAGLLGFKLDLHHPALHRVAWLMAPATLGAAAYQFSVFVNTLLASFLPEGSVSYLYYADRIMQFPLGVFAVAVATAVLPAMSRQAAEKDLAGLRDTLSYSLRLVSFITIPATVGMIILAEPGLQLLFQRGRFDLASTQATTGALIAYALGLWSLSAVQIIVRAFYALQDTRTPATMATISLIGSLALAVILMIPLEHVGLALASTGGSIINFAILIVLLRRKLGRLGGRVILKSIAGNIVWSLAMGVVVASALYGYDPVKPGRSLILGLRVLGGTGLGLGVYFGLAYWRRAPEILVLLNGLRRRRKKTESPVG
ncbi:MAG: murein biosynthesis integral membrane protein MurJ [Deltaproteobacteria bacterium]|nr:murein biosynthesis integral membrane protein MurJ [Deltaproteobacteria bacterium]